MTPLDNAVLQERLEEAYGAFGKNLPPKAAKAWVQTCKEFPIEDVVSALDVAVKSHTRPPVPADIWKLCNEWRTDRIEREAKEFKAKEEREAAAFWGGRATKGNAVAEDSLREMKEILARPRPHPKQWARKIIARYHAGEYPHGIHHVKAAYDALGLPFVENAKELEEAF